MERHPRTGSNGTQTHNGTQTGARQRPGTGQRPSNGQRSANGQRPGARQRPSNAQRPSGAKRPSNGQRQTRQHAGANAPSSSAGRRLSPAQRERIRRRRAAELRRKRLILLGGIAAAAVILAVVILILVNTFTVPEAKDLRLESSASAQVLSWKGKPKKISYQIFRKTADSDYELVATIPEGAESSFVSRDLTSATLYDYKIVAVKGSGENARESKGKTVSAYTLPLTITECKARTLSKDSLTLMWPDAQPVDGFEIRYGLSADLSEPQLLTLPYSQAEKDPENSTVSATIPGLEAGTSLFYSIRSFCGEEIFSEWSEVFNGTVTRAIDMTGIDLKKPMIALTFDDGPDNNDVTNRILDSIEAVGGKATFFQLGQLVEAFPEVSKRIVDDGHQMACHTYDHEHMGDAVTPEDITRANDAIQTVTGVRPSAFRCPGGELTDTIRSTCESEGQAIYYWWLDTRDWSSRDADSVVSVIEENVADGDIVLMHNIYESTAEAVERIVPWLTEKGYQLVTVDQLIQAKTGEPPAPGVQYFSGNESDAKKDADTD